MEEYVEVPIPEGLEEFYEEGLRNFFQSECDGKSDFLKALDLECEPQNSRAVLDGLTVSRVAQIENKIAIEYSVELSEYQACKDKQDTWDFDRTLIGVRIDNAWKFKKHVSTDVRSTDEEF